MSVLMKAKSTLEELEYNYSNSAVSDIVAVWSSQKQNLIDHLRNHPNWNEDQKAIIFSQDYERKINVEGIDEFKTWGGNILRQRMMDTTIKELDGRPIRFYIELNKHKDDIQMYLNRLDFCFEYIYDRKPVIAINEIERKDFIGYMQQECDKFLRAINGYQLYGQNYVKKKEYDDFIDFGNIMDQVKNAETSLVDESLYNYIMNRVDVKIAVGMKISKAVQKVCQVYGLDKIVDIQPVTHNGITRDKDYGYNYRYALFSDSINTVKITRHTVLSVNMIDYWLMSHGHKWSSCHNVDKKHVLGSNDDYSGRYSGGTESYMLDSSAVVFYTVDSDYDGDDFCMQEKMQRCMFFINRDGSVIVQGRVYPDGRDGGDSSYAKQFREVVQKIVSECWNVNNQWTLKKGTGACEEVTVSEGVHYKDYLEYEDCNVSLNKEIYDEQKVYIGYDDIICPCCGIEHNNEQSICCESCASDFEHYAVCERCGDGIDENDDYIYCNDNDSYYCCEDCAERDEVHYCVDDDQWHTETNCYKDDYEDEWYSGSPEVETEDGCTYSSEENAEADCYMKEPGTGRWYPEDQFVSDGYTGEMFIPDRDTVEIGDKWYMNDENAIADGYVYDEETSQWKEAA